MEHKYKVNFYSKLTSVKENNIIYLSTFLNDVKTGTYKTQIEALRQLTGDEYKEQKKLLPCITPSGTFAQRNAKGLLQHSGIICIDVDNINWNLQQITAFKKDLNNGKYNWILALFFSPSNKGLKFFVCIDPIKHLPSFIGLQTYFKDVFKLDIDISCKDVSRLCFVSYDPEIYINEAASIFEVQTTTTAPPPEPKKINNTTSKQSEVELLIKKIERTGADITQGYENWLNIGFALASEFGPAGEDYFHSISKNNAGYDFAKCSDQFKKCCNSKSSGIHINTLFTIAKDNNVLVYEASHTSELKPNNATAQESITESKEIIFYSPVYKMQDGTQVLTDLKINYVKFDELIYSLGYRRFDMESDYSFIRIQNNVITQVQPHQIQDHFLNYINGMPDIIAAGIQREYLKTKIYKAPENYCSVKRLALLQCGNVVFNEDTKHESFIYYKNGFVLCNKDGWSLQPYKNLKGYIWQSQIIDRDFKHINFNDFTINQMGVYAQFMFNVCNKNEANFISLCSLTGYLLHSFTDTKLRAIILTDSGISEEANGRTGKTLFGNTLRHIKKITQINGKDFDPTNKNKYQEANLDTQIIFLNDVRTNFRFENLYNDITEGITVEKKNKNPFKVKAKMCITTNKTISIEGGSSKDRALEFEFSNHYSENYSPENEFKHRFFSDWTKEEWGLFDNFMMYCICIYLGNGIVEPKNENLAARKLLDSTNRDFLEFMNDNLQSKFIEPNKEFKKAELHKKFIGLYPEYEKEKYKGTSKTFYGWLIKFAKYDNRFTGEMLERRSSGDRFNILVGGN